MSQITHYLGADNLKRWDKFWEDRFNDAFPSIVTRVPLNIYNLWLSEIELRSSQEPQYLMERARWLINNYMRKHHPGHKIQAMCEVSREDSERILQATGTAIAIGFYIKHRQMSLKELREHDAVQPLFKQTEHDALLQKDPMWLLEESSDEFRSQLNVTDETNQTSQDGSKTGS